jgi:predicted O-methyltransferase YrrM
LSDELRRRYAAIHTFYPLNFGIEEGSGLLLYAIMRLKKPLVTLETGVANDESTFFILNAIQKNQRERLYSTEVSDNIGTLLNDDEKQNWALQILNTSNLKKTFLRTLDEIGSIDLFLHDSNHSYLWQRFELDSIEPKIVSNSIIIADDAHASYAFIDFSRKLGTKPMFLLDKRKVLRVLVNLEH